MTAREMDDMIDGIRQESIRPLRVLAETDLPEWDLFQQWEIEGLCERILKKLRECPPEE